MVPGPEEAGVSFPTGTPRCVCCPAATGGEEGVGELHLERAAIPANVRVLRTAVRSWAAGAGLTEDVVESVVLAVDEAVTNAVDHARPPQPDDPGGTAAEESPVRIVLGAASRACGGGVAVSVGDDGTWRPPPSDPGHRGRGVQLIGRLADRSTVAGTAHGTTVRMCWTRT